MPDETPKTDESTQSSGEPRDLPRADFSAHVYTIAMQALIFLGKQPHPETGKYERNLEIARFQIDTLEVLREKTKGNLTGDEDKLLDTLLHSCHMAFVDESKRPA
jgi:hypothetical protein